ncbi:flagellar protein FliO/FliZ [Motilibacter peucedani]|uniref:Flagellar protein FliO/FliZ n=1 Tax=Motilibacter peucedani TaxID=598650 RepID=A0A420XTP0_9ACTN|nr:flagellar biosynthetic protein FliO [Motilibacter peucedani]RKS80120.1 flagellar protein FliO/FliZ [Motilibacter peucedani]
MSTAHLMGQLVVSLGAVLALMWLAAKVMRRAGGGRVATTLDVVARKQLSRSASVSVVRIGERAIILGVTEGTVTMLGETTLEELELEVEEPAVPAVRAPGRRRALTAARPAARPAADADAAGALTGSILSPTTWKQTVEVLRERTARRG